MGRAAPTASRLSESSLEVCICRGERAAWQVRGSSVGGVPVLNTSFGCRGNRPQLLGIGQQFDGWSRFYGEFPVGSLIAGPAIATAGQRLSW